VVDVETCEEDVLDEVLVLDGPLLDVDLEVAVVAINLAVVALVAESLARSEASPAVVAKLDTPMSAVSRRTRRTARSRRAIDAATDAETGGSGTLVVMTNIVANLPRQEVSLRCASAESSENARPNSHLTTQTGAGSISIGASGRDRSVQAAATVLHPDPAVIMISAQTKLVRTAIRTRRLGDTG
jgi:hypothetical protein